jgi:glycosyltransferase involved in cell wall biosynthesis
MRIVYFYQYFGTSKGGWSTRVHEMCKRWVEAGHHVTVVTTPYDKSDIEKFKGLTKKFDFDGIEVIVLNFLQSNKHHKLKRMLRFAQFITTATFYVFKLKYDVAIASSGPITVGFLGLVAKKLRRKKFVFEVRDLWPAGSIELGIIKNKSVQNAAFWFEQKCYKNADLIVACSEGMKKDIEHRFNYQHILVVPNACDTNLFAVKAATTIPDEFRNKKLILYTGSLGVMDHCMQIMQAAKYIDPQKYPDTRVVIIGDGVERKMMEDFAAAEKLTHVYFLGLIPKTEVVGWLQQAYCTIVCFKDVPILNTVSPNKMFDAFASGLPIVQTTKGWIKDLLASENCGISVMPDEPQQMAAALEQYLNNPALRAQHGENALGLAYSTFSRDKCAADMINGIEKIVR